VTDQEVLKLVAQGLMNLCGDDEITEEEATATITVVLGLIARIEAYRKDDE